MVLFSSLARRCASDSYTALTLPSVVCASVAGAVGEPNAARLTYHVSSTIPPIEIALTATGSKCGEASLSQSIASELIAVSSGSRRALITSHAASGISAVNQ